MILIMNPIVQAVQQASSFTFFHTHIVDQMVLDSVKHAGKSIEIDISVDENGLPYIGHPLSFYEFENIPKPDNLPVEYVLNQLIDTDIFIVLDCKDERAIPLVYEIIERFGVERIAFHSWIDALLFGPYPDNLTIEPHWELEDLPFKVVRKLYDDTKVPILASARGLTAEKLNDSDVRLRIKNLNGIVVAINAHLSGGAMPDSSFLRFLTSININPFVLDFNEDEKKILPSRYVRASNRLEDCGIDGIRAES